MKQRGFINDISVSIFGILLVIVFFYGVFQLKRWFNYRVGYQSQVIEEICNNVKPAYLKDPSICQK